MASVKLLTPQQYSPNIPEGPEYEKNIKIKHLSLQHAAIQLL